jgi:hypothetical protein
VQTKQRSFQNFNFYYRLITHPLRNTHMAPSSIHTPYSRSPSGASACTLYTILPIIFPKSITPFSAARANHFDACLCLRTCNTLHHSTNHIPKVHHTLLSSKCEPFGGLSVLVHSLSSPYCQLQDPKVIQCLSARVLPGSVIWIDARVLLVIFAICRFLLYVYMCVCVCMYVCMCVCIISSG